MKNSDYFFDVVTYYVNDNKTLKLANRGVQAKCTLDLRNLFA